MCLCVCVCVSRKWRVLNECVKFSFWQVGQHQKHGANFAAVSRQHIHKNPYLQHFSLDINISPYLKQTQLNFSCSFTAKWQMQTSGRNANFSGQDEANAGKRVICALLWGLCSVHENILVFKASCLEPPLCVLISTTPIQIRPFLIRQMQTSACRGQRVTCNKSKHIRGTLFS